VNRDDSKTLWHGRFAGGPADELMAYTVSLPFDRRLWRDDIACSRAHVAGLAHVGILTDTERDAVLAALDVVESEMAADTFVFAAGDEDIHTAVERRVTEICGAPGAKLHTGRSRNDQSVTGLRLWCKREVPLVAARIVVLQEVLLDRAREAGVGDDAVYLPGYTHVQRAQPVLLAHHLLAHGWAFGRDIERLLDALERVDVSPLGAGALAGSSLPLDPDFTARELGFARAFDNSLDAVSDRDFVAEILFALSLVAVHLSRIGEEWVLWTSDEFGFAVLDDAYATGSSMLPQKKNADIAELARGKAGRVIGDLTGLLTTLKGLPLAYNRDLQEDKWPPLIWPSSWCARERRSVTRMPSSVPWCDVRWPARGRWSIWCGPNLCLVPRRRPWLLRASAFVCAPRPVARVRSRWRRRSRPSSRRSSDGSRRSSEHPTLR